VLFSDATIITETPPLRASWSPQGEPARIAVTGDRRNRTLYGTISMATGHRVVEEAPRWNGQTWRDHLLTIRRTWRGWRIILFLDRGRAKQFFQAAVDDGRITISPFAKMKDTAVKANKSRDHEITREVAANVIDACPDAEWRLIFTLARYGGL
jgi:hypothetical protein